MGEEEPKSTWVYHTFVRVALLAAVVVLIAVILLLLRFLANIENAAPAEMRLLLDVLKNRFFR